MKSTISIIIRALILGTILYLSIRIVNNTLRGTPIEDTPLYMYLAEWFITFLASWSVLVLLHHISVWFSKKGIHPIKEILLVSLVCLALYNFWMFVPILFIANGGYDATNFLTVSLLGWLWTLIYYLSVRGKQLLNAYVETKIKSERLEHERLKSENRSLREQVNPHFLFNSLNTLSELVMDNPQAETFIDKLANVYRYLLQNNQNDLCVLESELRFAKAYFHLLETRHGSAVRMEINIEPSVLTKQLPPMTLQLLIENAIKHNAISINEPLVIHIYSDGDRLVVENNIRKRSGLVLSGKVGLSNIVSKYQLLGIQEVQVSHTDEKFKVWIPLL